MSDNSELKQIAKKALQLGLEAGVPVAKKALSSNTGQALVMLAADMAQDVLSSVYEKTKEKDTPKKAWNQSASEKINMDIANEVEARLKKDHPELYEKLSSSPKGKK